MLISSTFDQASQFQLTCWQFDLFLWLQQGRPVSISGSSAFHAGFFSISSSCPHQFHFFKSKQPLRNICRFYAVFYHGNDEILAHRPPAGPYFGRFTTFHVRCCRHNCLHHSLSNHVWSDVLWGLVFIGRASHRGYQYRRNRDKVVCPAAVAGLEGAPEPWSLASYIVPTRITVDDVFRGALTWKQCASTCKLALHIDDAVKHLKLKFFWHDNGICAVWTICT